MRFLLVLLVPLLACAPRPPSSTGAADRVAFVGEPLVVFLVRHGEKVDASADPPLSEAGQRRAEALAHALADADLDHVHASEFLRTEQTARPTALAAGLEIEPYDPRDLPALAKRLRGMGGRHLVVGHSNTTPAAAELLGGGPSTPIREADEYDRLYVVTVGAKGASGVLLRFGEPTTK